MNAFPVYLWLTQTKKNFPSSQHRKPINSGKSETLTAISSLVELPLFSSTREPFTKIFLIKVHCSHIKLHLQLVSIHPDHTRIIESQLCEKSICLNSQVWRHLAEGSSSILYLRALFLRHVVAP